MAPRRTPGHGMENLRGVLSAGHLRALLGVRDAGRVALAKVRNAFGGEAVEHDGRDLLVHVVDVLTNLPALARLHVPANILWRKPRTGETLTVVTPADINGPGAPVALYGDAGADNAVPPWIDTKAGLYADETVRVESRSNDVEVHVADGHAVKLGAAATKGVNRQGDPVDCGSLQFTFTPGMAAALAITYTPPSGMGAPVTLPTGSGTINLVGKTGTGSAKVKAED